MASCLQLILQKLCRLEQRILELDLSVETGDVNVNLDPVIAAVNENTISIVNKLDETLNACEDCYDPLLFPCSGQPKQGAPSGTIVFGSDSPTSDNPIEVRVLFDEPVTDLSLLSILVANGVGQNLERVNSCAFRFEIVPNGPGRIEVTVVDSAVQDIDEGLFNVILPTATIDFL